MFTFSRTGTPIPNSFRKTDLKNKAQNVCMQDIIRQKNGMKMYTHFLLLRFIL